MKFYLYERQPEPGCDYSIGCGIRLTLLKATTMAEAIQEATPLASARYFRDRDDATEEASVIAVAKDISLHSFILDLQAKEAEESAIKETEKRKAEERAEYERLHAIYGTK